MAEYQLNINGAIQTVEADPAMPLLWVIRDLVRLTGTKYGCGIGQCGACTVHVDGQAVRSCVTPVAGIGERAITTIEGLSEDGDHPVQAAWLAEMVTQCGYCQPGQIMSAAALLNENPTPTEDQIEAAMSGNLCRCGTYQRIKRAVLAASGQGG